MSKFFINRPIFAWVIAIFIIIIGGFSLTKLPIEQYPNVSSPQINIEFSYTGATAEVIQDSVISIIEEQMNSVEDVDYMESKAYANGTGQISLTFASGVDKDFAQVDVQNKLSQVENRLPSSVLNSGITVSQSQTSYLLFVALYAEDGSSKTDGDVSDYAIRNIKPELQRIEGVGGVTIFGSEQAMRIWVDPQKLKSFDLSVDDVETALSAQNVQVTAGSLGALPNLPGQQYNYTISVAGSQLTTAEQFANIIVKHSTSGATVRIKDIGSVELGSQSYSNFAQLNGRVATGIGVQLSSTGNASAVANSVRTAMENMSQYIPAGIAWDIPYDSSLFVNISIEKVEHTLIEAIILVFIVMYLFLQNIRYTIIPTIVVPISLLGGLSIMYYLGLSINVLSMFAMVLVIGIVVDDAIVVVENVERLMGQEKLTPYQAAQKGMSQITSAIIGITIVLIVVFVPMSFFSGTTGKIYRQFSIVMACCIGISAFMALTLTPALCATILKPVSYNEKKKTGFFRIFNPFITLEKMFFDAFNKGLNKLIKIYESAMSKIIKHSFWMLIPFLAIIALSLVLFRQLPSSFLPTEDQGTIISSYQLPSGATRQRTLQAVQKAEKIMHDQSETNKVFSVLGFSFSGQGQNMALTFTLLKDWSVRTKPSENAIALSGRLQKLFAQKITEGYAIALVPPAIQSLGTTTGFEFRLEDRGGDGLAALTQAKETLLQKLRTAPEINGATVRVTQLDPAPQMQLTIDRDAAYAKGVTFSSISTTLGEALGSSYVNDFPNNGRMQRVYLQATAAARMQPEDIMALTVPNSDGDLVPLSEVMKEKTPVFKNGPQQVTRYNGYTAFPITGSPASGYSSGEAMNAVLEAAKALPQGYGIEWTGTSLEEQRAGNSAIYLYTFSILAVFLCLAALYESWSIPFAVLLVLPLGFLGAVFGTWFRGFDNDIYFKVGMITVIGLSAKNAILIIEFAKDAQESGMSLAKSALQAAHLRFRPIVMTSLAFISGMIPLYFATGASSVSQQYIGTSVLWGMLVGTILAIFFVPCFYVIVRKVFGGGGPRVLDKYAAESENGTGITMEEKSDNLNNGEK